MMLFNRILHVSILAFLVLNSTILNAVNDSENDDFIKSLDTKCAYTDGYQCHQSDPSFYSLQSQTSLVPAVYMSTWAVVYDAFLILDDLTEAQKDLRHYKIGFAEQDDQILVLFSAILLPYLDGEKPEGISTGSFGRSIKFWVDKKTMSVNKRLYLK